MSKNRGDIKRTIDFWQDMLARLHKPSPPADSLTYPKSLGELCLELNPPKFKYFTENNEVYSGWEVWKGPKDRLRQAMYHNAGDHIGGQDGKI